MDNQLTFSFFVFLFACLTNVNGQDLSQKQEQRLDRWGLNYSYLLEQSADNEQMVLEILAMDRKRRSNILLGSGLTALGVFLVASGISLYNRNSDCTNCDLYDSSGDLIVGGGLILLGAANVGFSIPLFISSSKRKRIRDAKIRALEEAYPLMPRPN